MQRYQSKASVAYTVIRDQILDGTLVAGSVLNQEQVAASLGISTTPVREALRRLESEGFVRMPAHRYATVASLDLSEFLPLFDVRAELDTMAAGYAAVHHLERDRIAMRAAVDALDDHPDDRIRAMRDFYSSIYHASHDPILIDHLTALWDQSNRYQHALRDYSLTFPHMYSDIVAAVESGDPARAELSMRTHLDGARAAINHTIEIRHAPITSADATEEKARAGGSPGRGSTRSRAATSPTR